MWPSCAGEEGQDFITVEGCGDDFLGALADAVQPTDEWDDLNGIETEACGNLNDMMMKSVPQCEAAVPKGSSGNHAPEDLEDSDFSLDDDSDFEMGDEMDYHRSGSLQRNAPTTRSSKTQSRSSAKSGVSHLFPVPPLLAFFSFSCD